LLKSLYLCHFKADNTYNILVLRVLVYLGEAFPVLGVSHPELCKTSRQMFGAAINTNEFHIATDGPALASGEKVTGGLVAARSLVAARGHPQLGRWTARPMYQFFMHCFLTLHQVSAKCTTLMRIMLAL